MHQVIVTHNPSAIHLESLNVNHWPTWEKEVSIFDWVFPEQETAYILAGECEVTAADGTKTSFSKGDLVTFPAGLKVSWEVKKPLRKHYKLDGNVITQMFRRIKIKLGL